MSTWIFALALGAFGCRNDMKPDLDTGALGGDDTSDPVVEPDDTGEPADTDPPDTDPPVDTGDSGDSGEPVDDDLDGDGYPADEDCDDSNSEIHPGAEEVCDGLDNDCDLLVDPETATDATSWWLDLDGDGYGDVDQEVVACDQPSGFVDDATDCDDAEETVYPGAAEICDGLDNDCDGLGDEDDPDTVGSTTWYLDADGDGAGSSAYAVDACDQPEGFADNTDDCDDGDDTVFTGANEVCDEQDNDCDGDIDEAAEGAGTWYLDSDGDGYGDAGTSTESCDGATGYVADATDCDDADGDVNPSVDELCDGIDNDCDGLIDDDDDSLADADTWYADLDGDGYGDADDALEACSASDRVADATDCDDGDGDVNPDADEVCDEVDNDCDTLVDDDDPGLTDASTWWLDYDGDGLAGDSYSTESCDAPTGYVATTGDCDDADADIGDSITFYADTDSDGYGDADSTVGDCDAPTGYVSDATDCDDGDGDVNPGADEVCDEVDNDCDGDVDVDASDETTWNIDYDGDGYGSSAYTADGCDAPDGYVADDTDCDDADASVSPVGTEACNGVDDDCDGDTDEDDAVDVSTWYVDADGDGYGDVSSTDEACDQPSGYSSDATDCDDTEATVNPGASELCNGVDDDCDGEADLGVIGSDVACAGESCLDVLERGSPTGTGDFWLDDGAGGTYEEECVFGTVGGGWAYRVDFTIENPTGDDLSDEWVALVLDTETLLDDAKLQSAGEDIRFFTHDGPLMEHWIESGFDSSATTWWIQVPELGAGETLDFTLTYSNPDTERTALGWHFDDFGTNTVSDYSLHYAASWGTPTFTLDTSNGWLGTDISNMDYFASVTDLEVGEPVYVAVRGWIYDNDAIGATLMDSDGGYTTAVVTDDYDGDDHNGGLEIIVHHDAEPANHYEGDTLVSAGNIVSPSSPTVVGLGWDGTELGYYLDHELETSVAASYTFEAAGLGTYASSGSPGAVFDWLWIGSEPIDFDPASMSSDAVSTVGSESSF